MELVSWQHPTTTRLGVRVANPPPPKSVHLVGLGPSAREFVWMWLNPETPELLYERDEIWTVNRAVFGSVPHDLLFVMDNITQEAEQFPIYGRRLWQHDRPIITSDNLEGWPAHVHAYPFEAIMAWAQRTFRVARVDWFVNSMPYALLYAAWIGVEEVYCWGMDFVSHSSGKVVEDGHPNVAYWIAKVEEAGVNVIIPRNSSLCDANHREVMYGYQHDPRPGSAARRQLFWESVKGG
jgi:hypothetical protein